MMTDAVDYVAQAIVPCEDHVSFCLLEQEQCSSVPSFFQVTPTCSPALEV